MKFPRIIGQMLFATLLLGILTLSGCANAEQPTAGETIVVRSSEPAQPEEQPIEPLPRAKPAVPDPIVPVLRVDFLDVDHADATLVRTPEGKTVLVNCGTLQTGERILKFLAKQQVARIDVLLATDARAESIGGCAAIKGSVPVAQYLESALGDIARGGDGEALKKRGPYLRDGERMLLDLKSDATIELIAPYTPDEGKRAEDNALVLKVSYGANRVLLLGNCGIACQRKILSRDLRADVLQLAQHATLEANGDKLLDAVQPSVAVASVGFNNAARLPRKDLIQKLNQRRIQLYRTDVQHTVSVESDGRKFTVESEVPYKIENQATLQGPVRGVGTLGTASRVTPA